MMNPYIGHSSQLGGVEEHRLIGGRGDGMRLYEMSNGRGVQLTVCPDRNNDIARLRFRGVQMNYTSPCGYVAPAYYGTGGDWLKCFTAGFLTTCGLENVGVPCEDQGEALPLHGSIACRACERSSYEETDGALFVRGVTSDEVLFGRKLTLAREIALSKAEDSFTVTDVIANTGDTVQPFEILYHMNMGHPLLDEDSVLSIPSARVTPRDAHAGEDIGHWMRMEKPQAGYRERCYYHWFDQNEGYAEIYQPKLGVGLRIVYDAKSLDSFVEWKMMGVRDYVLGLECGNCTPDGRDAMRDQGKLKFLSPGERVRYQVRVALFCR